jgi:cytochrome c peroxidase/DNA-binding beta-propeller fold protein YncE
MYGWTLLFVLVAATTAACSSPSPSGDAAPPAPAPSASAATPPATRVPAPVREGGALARTVRGDALIVADEDHHAVRTVGLPLSATSEVKTVNLPGAPAQVLALDDRVLVTVRASSALAEKTEDGGAPKVPDAPKPPGLLLVMKPDASAGLVEIARVPLPADAWGIAITPDEKTALVSSAWTHKVSSIDLASAKVSWTVDVAREPRGIVVRPDGAAAYVTHLVGADLTRIDDLRGAPRVSKVALPPSPARSFPGQKIGASLGYSAVLSPDGERLFVGRHALGVLGWAGWFGAATVDVLTTKDDKPLLTASKGGPVFIIDDLAGTHQFFWFGPGTPFQSPSLLVQPRALAYRKSTRTVLVASEGLDALVELDAEALDPSLAVVQVFPLGNKYDPFLKIAAECGAPSGISLSADERTAWVVCRSTGDVVSVALDAFIEPKRESDRFWSHRVSPARTALVHLADDALPDMAAKGRRLFYNATNMTMSRGLACAGCHPEGRDDGHVWHEAKFNTKDGTQLNFIAHQANVPAEESVRGAPRRTPMLAGMVAAAGPYGWHGESPDLPSRLNAGFGLHRWGGMPPHDPQNLSARSGRLAAFLRKGLVPPPVLGRELDATEQRGRALFGSPEVGCAACHVPETGYTNRAAYPLAKLPLRAGFDEEDKTAFKTPSLRWVGGRAPYFHDGRAPSLEWIINNNTGDRMGTTNHLSGVDRAALVAFLKTL